MWTSLFFDIFYGFRDIRVQRIAKITPLPKLGGNYGLIVLVGGGDLDSTAIATYTVVFIQISQPFRKILTDKLFRTNRRTYTHVKLKTSFLGVFVLVESGNVLNSTSKFCRYSNTSIRSRNMACLLYTSDAADE